MSWKGEEGRLVSWGGGGRSVGWGGGGRSVGWGGGELLFLGTCQ